MSLLLHCIKSDFQRITKCPTQHRVVLIIISSIFEFYRENIGIIFLITALIVASFIIQHYLLDEYFLSAFPQTINILLSANEKLFENRKQELHSLYETIGDNWQ